jgi:hypothetical protein
MLSSVAVFAQRGERMRMQAPAMKRGEQIMERQPNRVVQQKPPGARVQSVRENFIHKQLDLTPEQSERFVPLYHQYLQELGNVYRLKKLNSSDVQTNSSEQINKDIIYDSQLVEIRKRYMNEFFKIMPPEKVSLMLKSEHDFNQAVIKEMSERNANTAASPPPSN